MPNKRGNLVVFCVSPSENFFFSLHFNIVIIYKNFRFFDIDRECRTICKSCMLFFVLYLLIILIIELKLFLHDNIKDIKSNFRFIYLLISDLLEEESLIKQDLSSVDAIFATIVKSYINLVNSLQTQHPF